MSEGLKSRMRFNHYECVPVGVNRRESKAQSFLIRYPWVAVRRAKLDPVQPVPDSVGRESSRFLWLETLEKPDNGINDCRTCVRMSNVSLDSQAQVNFSRDSQPQVFTLVQ